LVLDCQLVLFAPSVRYILWTMPPWAQLVQKTMPLWVP